MALCGSLRVESNNDIELQGLIKGICIVIQHEFSNLVVEGDSHIFNDFRSSYMEQNRES